MNHALESAADFSGEKNTKGSGDKSPPVDSAHQARENLLADAALAPKDTRGQENTSSGLTGTLAAAGRSLASPFIDDHPGTRLLNAGKAVGEGLALTGSGIWSAAAENIRNPLDLAGKAAVGLGMGVGFRVLLPKSGALSSLIGTAFTLNFAKDAALPVVEAWREGWNSSHAGERHQAAQKMGAGLGNFAVDSAIMMGTGAAGSWATGRFVMEGTRTGRSIEAWKDFHLNSPESRLGSVFRKLEFKTDQAAAVLSDKIRPGQPTSESASLSGNLEAIREAGKSHQNLAGQFTEAQKAEAMLNAQKKLDMQLEAKRSRQQFSHQIDELLGTGDLAAARRSSPGESALMPRKDFLARSQVKDLHEAAPQAPAGKDGQVVGSLGVTMREVTQRVTPEDIKLARFRDDAQSAVDATLHQGKPLLTEAHRKNADMLTNVIGEVKSMDIARDAAPLIDHYTTAHEQLVLAEKGAKGGIPQVDELNLLSRSHSAKQTKLLKDNGISPETIQPPNPPMFTIRESDAGPYTIPAIPRVTDSGVVVMPREYEKVISVHTSGVYNHEIGHNWFGPLRFPRSLREQILTENVIGKAMKDNGIADVSIDVPGAPGGKMMKSAFLREVLLGQASENTPDMFATLNDPNTGLSLAVLLSSLRPAAPGGPKNAPGLLETRSMYGSKFAREESPLGVEVHGIDRARVKTCGEVLRQNADGNKSILAHADFMDRLAAQMSRPDKDYIWAAMDQPGKAVRIPIKEFDALIPNLVEAQFNTPLDAFGGKTLKQVFPSLKESFPRIETLAEQMAQAALAGRENLMVPFNKNNVPIEEVFSAGLLGWTKAVQGAQEKGAAGRTSPEALLDRINIISENLRSLYRGDNPEAILAPPFKVSDIVVKPANALRSTTADVLADMPRVRNGLAWTAPVLGRYALPSVVWPSLMQPKQIEDELLKPKDK